MTKTVTLTERVNDLMDQKKALVKKIESISNSIDHYGHKQIIANSAELDRLKNKYEALKKEGNGLKKDLTQQPIFWDYFLDYDDDTNCPMISAFQNDGFDTFKKGAIEFIVNPDTNCVEVKSFGLYKECYEEVATIINNYLKGDFSSAATKKYERYGR